MSKRTSIALLLFLTPLLSVGSLAQERSAQDSSAFGLVKISSIDAVLAGPFARYESGALRLDPSKLALTIGFEARPDGSLDAVRLVRSSGVPQIDDAARGLVAAASDAHAAGPLSTLRKIEVSMAPDGDAVRFEVSGESASAEEARTRAEDMGNQISVLRLFGARLTHATRRALELMRVSSSGRRVVGTVVIPRAEVYDLMRERYALGAQ